MIFVSNFKEGMIRIKDKNIFNDRDNKHHKGHEVLFGKGYY